MKLIRFLPFAAFASAFVIPDEEVISQITIESHQAPESVLDRLPSKDQAITEFENTFSKLIDTSKTAFDQALVYAAETGEEASTKGHEAAFDAKAWFESAANRVEDLGKHGHGKPNLTVGTLANNSFHRDVRKQVLIWHRQQVYQLIAESKYTTKLAALVNEYPDVVELLNGTAANYTGEYGFGQSFPASAYF